jgi:hypothetical protein
LCEMFRDEEFSQAWEIESVQEDFETIKN